jgi:2-polyprenyl-3-methyl-5-hydroxy-6-metoxy-1,4-benzoquinol methylase
MDIVRCVHCGLVSLRSLPSVTSLQDVYDQEYSTGESFKEFYADLAVARRTEAVLRVRRLRGLTAGRRLLDVGSGMGHYVEAALAEGWDAEGLEISERAIALHADRSLPVHRVSFEDFEAQEPYDAITLWAFLEHVVDPLGALEKCYRLLRPGGIAVIETGDISSRNARIDGSRWRMFAIAGHLHFLSSDCLDQALESVGLVVLATRLDKWVEHTLMQRGVEGSLLTANRIMPPVAGRIAALATHHINRVAGRMGLGDVMIKIARKAASC